MLAPFRNLTRLWADKNRIVNITPLRDMPRLRDLDLSYNYITEVSAVEGRTG